MLNTQPKILTRTISIMMFMAAGSNFVHADNVLPTIKLKADDQDQQGYTVQKSKSATKMELALKDTPQSVSVITKEQIQDQQLKTLSEVLDQTPGIYQQRYGAAGVIGTGGEYASYYARGSQIINFILDGANTSPAIEGRDGLSVSSLDPAIYENITIVKGATGLTTGAGYPSAAINLNRKLATSKTSQGDISVSSSFYDDQWAGYRTTLDVQGALNNDGSVRGRTVVSYRDQDSWYDWGDYQTGLFYATLAWDISPLTTLNVGAMFQRSKTDGLSVHGSPNYVDGITKPLGRDVNTAPRWANGHSDTINAFAELTHRFENGWKWQANYNYLTQDTQALYAVVGSNAGVTGTYTANGYLGSVTTGYQDINPSLHSFDTSLDGTFSFFGKEHELIFGANYQNEQSDDSNYGRCIVSVKTGAIHPRSDKCSLSGTNNIVNLNTWDGNIDVPNGLYDSTGKRNKTDLTQYGYFAATRLNIIDPLHLLLGVRGSGYDYKTVNADVTTADFSENNQVTPYAGLTFDLTSYLTAYASYTNIFLPQAYRDYNYKTLDPVEGDNYEAGLKAAFYENKLNISAAYFESKLDNIAVEAGKYTVNDPAVINNLADPNESYYRTASGAKTKGFEIEANGELIKGWNVQTGYTYAETKENGTRINIDRPKQQFKLYTTYQLPVLDQKLKVGGGVRWQSEIASATATGAAYEANKQDAFTVVDIMAKYQVTNDFALGLNVNNVGDEEYRLNVSNGTYGDPRTYIVSMNYKF